MIALIDLQPRERRRVMDLLAEAGCDVSDWSNYKNGARAPAANPKYCYEWAFIEEGRFVVLNIWYEDLEYEQDQVVLRGNMRSDPELQDLPPSKAVWRKRADRFEHAVREAARERLPVRVIICSGRRRHTEHGDLVASKVQNRLLDPVSWAVKSFDERTGDFALMRGLPPELLVDQFDLDSEMDNQVETRLRSGHAYVRRQEVRRIALQRAAGHCEYCGQMGFRLPNGKIFLETHHIIPLGEGGPDTPENVAAICPNHHREVHYGSNSKKITDRLLEVTRTRT